MRGWYVEREGTHDKETRRPLCKESIVHDPFLVFTVFFVQPRKNSKGSCLYAICDSQTKGLFCGHHTRYTSSLSFPNGTMDNGRSARTVRTGGTMPNPDSLA